MRQTCLNVVHELAKADPRVIFIGSDLGAGTLQRLKEELPNQFFMEGVNEANVVGMAAGFALEGRIVYVNTLAVFLTRRALEQVALDVCLHNLNVRLIGNGGGLVYAPLGPTHMAVEDIALMRALPNMAIAAPADANEMRRVMPLAHEHQGPVYIRLGKGNDPIVTPDDEKIAFGKPVAIRKGADAVFITTGITLRIALEAARGLADAGIEAGIVHCPIVKPLDIDAIIELIHGVPLVVTIEEHVKTGGLGSLVAEILADGGLPHRLRRIAMPDAFPDRYGSQNELLKYYGITPENIIGEVRGFHQSRDKGLQPLAAQTGKKHGTVA